MKVVYIDLLFVTNLIPDYLLLRITAAMLGRYPKKLRLALGTLFAALCSLPLYLLPMSVYMSLCAKAVVCALVCLITFGRHKLSQSCTLFCAMSFAGGVSAICWLGLSDGLSVRGTAVYAHLSQPMLVCASLLAYCVIRLVFSVGQASRGGRKVKVEAGLLGRPITFSAYQDSGNTLFEPFSGRAVIVLYQHECIPLLPCDAARIITESSSAHLCFEHLAGIYPRIFSLIPYSTAAGNGLMLCIKPDEIQVNGKKENCIIGISPQPITVDGCSALIGV